MQKIKVSAVIFIVVFILAIFSSVTINEISISLYKDLLQMEEYAEDGDFEAVVQKYNDLMQYFEEKEILLELFLKHDSIVNIAITLHGIEAYLSPEHVPDLNCEIDKAAEQALRLDDMFISLF